MKLFITIVLAIIVAVVIIAVAPTVSLAFIGGVGSVGLFDPLVLLIVGVFLVLVFLGSWIHGSMQYKKEIEARERYIQERDGPDI